MSLSCIAYQWLCAILVPLCCKILLLRLGESDVRCVILLALFYGWTQVHASPKSIECLLECYVCLFHTETIPLKILKIIADLSLFRFRLRVYRYLSSTAACRVYDGLLLWLITFVQPSEGSRNGMSFSLVSGSGRHFLSDMYFQSVLSYATSTRLLKKYTYYFGFVHTKNFHPKNAKEQRSFLSLLKVAPKAWFISNREGPTAVINTVWSGRNMAVIVLVLTSVRF